MHQDCGTERTRRELQTLPVPRSVNLGHDAGVFPFASVHSRSPKGELRTMLETDIYKLQLLDLRGLFPSTCNNSVAPGVDGGL